MRETTRSGGCSIPVNAVAAEPLPGFAGQVRGRRRIHRDGGHPDAAFRADMDGFVVAILEDDLFEAWRPAHQHAPAAGGAHPFLRAGLGAFGEDHVVMFWHCASPS